MFATPYIILKGQNGRLFLDESLSFFGYDGTTYLLYIAMSMWFRYIQYSARYGPTNVAPYSGVLSIWNNSQITLPACTYYAINRQL